MAQGQGNARLGFTLVELLISVALFIVAISITLFAVVGTNGLIQKADARSVVSESSRGVSDAIRRAASNAAIGSVNIIVDQGKSVAIQAKAFSTLHSGNACTVIGRAAFTLGAGGDEQYAINKDGSLVAILIFNLDSGGSCPSLSTNPIYQNRLTNTLTTVTDAEFSLQNYACAAPTSTCVVKQLLRYSMTLATAQKVSGNASETRQSTLTIQDGVPIGLVNEKL